MRMLVGVVLLTVAATAAPAQRYDTILKGGTLVDGTGAPRRRADVALKGDRIVRIDSAIAPVPGADVIDVTGLVVAPGFIDNHAHIGPTIPQHPLQENFLRQGITTILASLHSTDQPWPMAPYLRRLQMAPNVAFFAGHNWIRKRVMGLENRAPSPAELRRMEALVAESMRAGAVGFSTGLEYVPNNYATTEEVIALARVASRMGGIYVTHMRDEGPRVLDAVRETIRIAREARIPAQINHLKVSGARQFGLSRDVLALIDSANANGLDVSLDIYPYTAFSTYSDIMFPQWSLAGGAEEFRKRAADAPTRVLLVREMIAMFPEIVGATPTSIQFRTLDGHPEFNGRTLADWLSARGQPNTVEAGVDALIELQLAGGFIFIGHAMDDADVVRFLQHPRAMVETDGDPIGLGEGFPHPRSYGSFPRVLARYVREQGVLTLETAVQKMTSMAADQINQAQRGRVRVGAFADLVVFSPERVQDLSTYTDPHHYSAGIMHVFVNGRAVIRSGVLRPEPPGRVLRGPARVARTASR